MEALKAQAAAYLAVAVAYVKANRTAVAVTLVAGIVVGCVL